MKSGNRLILAIGAAFSIFFVLIMLVILWAGWLLPEPLYNVSSYSEVVLQEILWGIQNTILETVILFVPMYIISLFFKSSAELSTIKRFSLLGLSVLTVTIFFTVHDIQNDLKKWEPLEVATRSATQRTFDLGRTSFIPMKQFTIYFSMHASDLSFIQQEILPRMKQFGYSAESFGITLGEIEYTSLADPYPGYHYLPSIEHVPFQTPLQRLDFASINFKKDDHYNALYFLTDNYEGLNSIEGMIRTD